MANPFDLTKYRKCCGMAPRFAREAGIWFAVCAACHRSASALDGKPEGLAGAWNEAMERKDGRVE
jgi:mono/diheme cytochrome c family protein